MINHFQNVINCRESNFKEVTAMVTYALPFLWAFYLCNGSNYIYICYVRSLLSMISKRLHPLIQRYNYKYILYSEGDYNFSVFNNSQIEKIYFKNGEIW